MRYTFVLQETVIKEETEKSHFTDNYEPWSLDTKLLAVSKKEDNSLYPVPIIKPGNTSDLEMSVSEVNK